MNNNIKIAIDFDGTISKTMDFVCNQINFKHGKTFSHKDIKTWSFWEDIGLGDDFWEIYDQMDKEYGRLHIKPYDNYIFDSLMEIELFTHQRFDILTCNNESARPHIEDWMIFNMTKARKHSLFNIKCLGRTTCKEKLALDFDLYLDDNPNMAEEIVNFPDKKMILFNCPWNKNVIETDQVKRVESWKEVPDLIKKFLTT